MQMINHVLRNLLLNLCFLDFFTYQIYIYTNFIIKFKPILKNIFFFDFLLENILCWVFKLGIFLEPFCLNKYKEKLPKDWPDNELNHNAEFVLMEGVKKLIFTEMSV